MYLRILDFVKRETVLCSSALLAALSCCFVPPSKDYLHYIDYRVLSLLFCLMTVIAGFSSIGVFRMLGERLLKKASSLRTLKLILVFLCFFSSMFITNDVALLTFVPFTLMILSMAERTDQSIFLIVMETIAANLGSMLTPLGNPQNLYLYTISGMRITDFILTMLPFSLVSLLLLTGLLIYRKNEPVSLKENSTTAGTPVLSGKAFGGRFLIYLFLFALCLLTVLHLLPYQLVLILIVAAFLLIDRPILLKVDYALLLTFLCFFIFIGNLKNITPIHVLLSSIISGHEFIGSILASQCISNVPAAVLLSGFTKHYAPLLIGVNAGGLGTLIASLASLISYKFYAGTPRSHSGQYIRAFTLYNLLFLLLLFFLYSLLY